MINSVDKLAQAQRKLAEGTALSKKELWELAQVYPELATYSGIFADSTVEQQKEAIDAIMSMKNDEKNAYIDGYIVELQAKAEALNQQIALEDQKAAVLDEIHEMEVNGKGFQDADYVAKLAEYNELEKTNYYNLEQDKVVANDNANQELTGNTEDAVNDTIDMYEDGADGEAEWSARGGKVAASNAANTANAVGTKYNSILPTLVTLAAAIGAAMGGATPGKGTDPGATGGISGLLYSAGLAGGVVAQSSYIGNTYFANGSNTQEKAERVAIAKSEYQKRLKEIQAEIGALENFKNTDIGHLNNDYSTSKKNSGSGSGNKNKSNSPSSSKSTGNSKIDSFTKEYESNVKSMQDRIVKALKQKYQELYNERKKQLEDLKEKQIKVHNDRIEQLQAEIDKLNGNTAEDKKSRLEGLKNSFQEWLSDDSTFGKARQKELLEQIEDLEKEIKIDNLEAEIDKEQSAIDSIEDYFSQLFDADSPLYDPVLKQLDQKMTDQSLYAEAIDMIKNQKTQEIIDLLTKYDSEIDGMAMLMGKTAGEIIAEEVRTALANYLDLRDNSITEAGGSHTLGLSTGSSSSASSGGSSSSSSTGGAPFVSKKDTYNKSRLDVNGSIIDRLRYHNFDSSFAAREKLYNYWGAAYGAYTGSGKQNRWLIEKMKQAGYSTGTYTGNNEGIAYLHKKERVLNPTQTKAFESLVYDFLPTISKELTGRNMLNKSVSTDNSVTFEKEVMSVHVDKIVNNTPYDVKNTEDNMNRMFKKAIKKSGVNIKL